MDDEDATLTVVADDIFQIEAIADEAVNERVFYNKDITNISSTTYGKFTARWRTSVASNGFGAQIKLVFTDASEQWLLEAAGVPQFNTSWTVTTGTITSGKTIDHVQFWADDYPNSVDSGTYYVYFDFLMLHAGTFTFPFVTGTEELELLNNIQYLKVPGRVGNITQYLGAESPTIRLSGLMDTDTSWKGSGNTLGYDLMLILKQMHKDPFQWLTSDLINCKVTMPRLVLRKVAGDKAQRDFSIEMRHYSKSSGDETPWGLLSWLGIT